MSNLGEYLKDLDQVIVPQDPLLDNKIPRPIMERGYCGGLWSTLESSWSSEERYSIRDCHSWPSDFQQPLSKHTSRELLLERQENIMRIAVYYEPEQSIVTKVKFHWLWLFLTINILSLDHKRC